MRYIALCIIVLGVLSCSQESQLSEEVLEDFLTLNSDLIRADLVACAGGKSEGFLGNEIAPTDVIFYPIEGAEDFRYFEAPSVADSADFSKYIEKELPYEPLFNGYLQKFNNIPFDGERMGIVTYKSPGRIHVCNAIRLKTNVKPTEVNNDLAVVIENDLNPSFSWEEGTIDENIIYFQVISDADNNFISGTYTIEREFTFYDLSNVVFNITDPSSTPTLLPNQDYRFSLMGVSDDNWVNLFIEKEFSTN